MAYNMMNKSTVMIQLLLHQWGGETFEVGIDRLVRSFGYAV